MTPRPRFFPTTAGFRRWLEANHARRSELLVGFHKRTTGRPSLTWPESVDEALCFGWIDGVRRRIDESSYCIRFTPRRAESTWSAVNTRRMAQLVAAGRGHASGIAAFARRSDKRSGIYSYEQRGAARLAPAQARRFRAQRHAWAWFSAQAPWYRRTAIYWVATAKQEATRERRLDQLIACSASGVAIPSLRRSPKPG